jgi:cytochrome bd-type quinol oxidase subunit 1
MLEDFPRYWVNLDVWRKLLIGESWLLHILIASFTLGAGALAPIAELIGVVKRSAYLERLARGLTLVNVVLYAAGATMAVAGLFLTWGFYPAFLSTLWWQFFWGLVAAEIAWVGELFVLLLYYFLWDKLSGRKKPIHILLGLMWIPMSFVQQAVLFPMVDFMMTPDPARPFFNPSVIPQLSHRVMGNLSWTGFAIAAYAGMAYLRAAKRKDWREASYYDWLGAFGAVCGVLFMSFFMAFSGYSWVAAAKGASPGTFYRMMVGPLAWLFQLQVFLIGFVLVVAAFYMWRRLRRSGLPTAGLGVIALVLGALWLFGSIPYYVGPGGDDLWSTVTISIGAMRPYKYIALGGLSLFGLVAVLLFVQAARSGLNWGQGGLAAHRALITLGFIGVLMMFNMGVIREKAKLPGLVHGQMNSREQVIPPRLVPSEDVHRPASR